MRSLFSSRLTLSDAVSRASPPSPFTGLSSLRTDSAVTEHPFSKPRGLRSRLWIKCPLLNAPLLPYCLQTKPILPPLGLWSILKWNQRRLIFLLGLHHKRYKSLEHPFSPVPSFKSEHSLFFSLSPPDSFSHCASSHPPRLGIVRRRILPQ